MGVPKKHTTKSARNQKRMHFFTKTPDLTVCSHCGQPVLPHTICPNCGYYKNVEIINVLAKLEKKERKRREKEIKEADKSKEEGENKKPMTMEELSRKKF